MFYLPQEMVNSQWSYYYNNNYFIVRTNRNCVTQYNTQYCDCYNVFQNNGYLTSMAYSCSSPNNQYHVDFSNITSDRWYRNDLPDTLIVFTILFIFIIYFPYKMIARLFGRWLKL